MLFHCQHFLDSILLRLKMGQNKTGGSKKLPYPYDNVSVLVPTLSSRQPSHRTRPPSPDSCVEFAVGGRSNRSAPAELTPDLHLQFRGIVDVRRIECSRTSARKGSILPRATVQHQCVECAVTWRCDCAQTCCCRTNVQYCALGVTNEDRTLVWLCSDVHWQHAQWRSC